MLEAQSSFYVSTMNSKLLKKYGITYEQFEKMYEKQNGRCAICMKAFVKSPHIDHCHRTKRVRGLLCTQCNTGLGMFKDEVGYLARAIVYLEDAYED